MNVIKIDGHVFVEDDLLIGAICNICKYRTYHNIKFIEMFGIHYIINTERYLTCKVNMIKNLLE